MKTQAKDWAAPRRARWRAGQDDAVGGGAAGGFGGLVGDGDLDDVAGGGDFAVVDDSDDAIAALLGLAGAL